MASLWSSLLQLSSLSLFIYFIYFINSLRPSSTRYYPLKVTSWLSALALGAVLLFVAQHETINLPKRIAVSHVNYISEIHREIDIKYLYQSSCSLMLLKKNLPLLSCYLSISSFVFDSSFFFLALLFLFFTSLLLLV
jgi:hypothetical protein